MSITEHTLTVTEGGKVDLRVSQPPGSRIRVIVLDETSAETSEALLLARLQDSTGFAREVLADPAEDIWNDL